MIHARGLVQVFSTGKGKKKREVRAVDGVDLDIAEGEVVGFLGPNGAGKTTTVRMMTTLSEPTSGTARVAGFDVRDNPAGVRRSMGLTGQAASVDELNQAFDRVDDQLGYQTERGPASNGWLRLGALLAFLGALLALVIGRRLPV